MFQSSRTSTVYRWPRARLVGPLGSGLVVLGTLWLVVAAVLAAVGSGETTTPYAVLGVLTVLALGAAALTLLRPPAVLEVNPEGYALHHLRGGGLQSARWSSVETVTTADTASGHVLLISTRQDGRSAVPLSLLGEDPADALRQVNELLNDAYGYRRLDL